MKKLLILSLLMAVLLFCVPALAETYVLDPIYGAVDVPETYVVLTPNNLTSYSAWLEGKGKNPDAVANDFIERGVLLQGWDEENSRLFELRAVETEESRLVFDVNEQETAWRSSYRLRHYPDNEVEGYDFSAADWKKTESGRFLVLKYVRRESGEILCRGNMRRTIRNGYEIDFDMQVAGRALSAKDNSELNKIWESFRFVEVRELPPAASAKIHFSKTPPAETNEQSFAITGTAATGVKLTAVVMGLSYPDPVVTEATAGSDGKFSVPIKLPREGVFLITLTGEYKDEEVIELAYPVTYQRTMLAVNFTKQPGAVAAGNEVKFAGTAEPGASIQIFVNGENTGTKKVTAEGKFAVTADLKEEGSYEVSLVFSKKGLADRRFPFTIARRWSDSEQISYLKKQAVKPAYSTLVSKIKGYEGKILGYSAYILDVSESAGEYIVRMALSKKNGKYSNIILVTANDAPAFGQGEKVMVYGTCEGMSQSGSGEDAEESFPCLSLILFVSLE